MHQQDNIGERIKQIISAYNLTQLEFAQKLNISQSMVSKLCSGDAVPSVRTMSDICKTFGIDIIWLETGCGQMHSTNAEDTLLAVFTGQTLGGSNHPIYRQFMLALSEASQDELQAIMRFAKRLNGTDSLKNTVYLGNLKQNEETPPEDPEA